MRDLMAASDRVDLWLTSCDDCDEHLRESYRDLLTDQERRAEQRFSLERDRRRYVVTRALVRTVLSRYVSLSPRAWRFAANAYGRPEIVNECDAVRALSFNVSHAIDVILVGVTRSTALGVDIEAIGASASLDVAESFFARDEAAALRALPPDRWVQQFFEYWTLKESYIKARGRGLSIPLDSFSLDLSRSGHIRFSLATPDAGADDDWRFWQLQPLAGHIAAVCVRHVSGVRRTLSLRKVVPLVAEESLRCPLLRQSHDID